MIDIALIPARGGSKGIPKKNLRNLGGISLVGRAIISARESNLVKKIVVSTDNNEIAEEAEKHDAQILWRDENLSGDFSKSIDVAIDALEKLDINTGKILFLQPTSPLRCATDIRASHQVYKNGRHHSVASVAECEHHPYKSLILDNFGNFSPVKNISFFESPRQQLPKSYRINGAIYINDIKTLIASRTFFGGSMGFYEMPILRSIDIDTELDLIIAEHLIDNKRDYG